jgi:hypothetical protein
MATQADVRRIALSLPGAEQESGRFAFSLRRNGKLKGFVWSWRQRVHPRKPKVPQPDVLVVRVASLDDKEFLLRLDPAKFFTEPHYDGYPAVLLRLREVNARELRPIITEAWRSLGPDETTTRARATRTKRPGRKQTRRSAE